MASSALHLDQLVEMREVGGRIVIEPVRAPVYDLQTMLAQMTPETWHDDTDFGAPVGNEAW
jgi:antitoxin MazE